MDTSNILALILGGIGFIISIISLIITPKLSLKSKQLEKRMEYRFELFQKILELWELSHNQLSNSNDFEAIMKEINKLIQLYGYEPEIKSFGEIVTSYNTLGKEQNEGNRQILMSKLSNFFAISFNAYRNEIALGDLVN